jgi:spermidine/putrescine transport system permease protein
MSARRARFTLPFLIFVTPVLMWLFLLIVLPHIDLLLMSFPD